LSVLALVASLGLPSTANAQTTGAVTVVVDATAPGAALERVWAYHGYDEINYTTTAEGRELLATLARAHTAAVHVRSHFLFNTGDGSPALKWGSTNLYSEDPSGNPIYSYALADAIMDATVGAGAFPFVELGFMPEALSTNPVPYRNSDTYLLDGGCFYPPRDYEKWGALVRTWAAHVQQRYPGAEATWQWELWNEPDIGYWEGTFEDYARLYDYTEAALHAVLPNASLGGPAVAGAASYYLPQFLEHCATGTNAVSGKLGTRLDMVSFHAKGGAGIADGHVQLDLGNQLRQHRTGFEAVARSGALASTPIVISEADPDGCAACPASEHPADAYRNSPAYGAYEVAMMKRSLELATEVGVELRGVLTWAFTFPDTPYFAGYRVLSTRGIHLPVLNAFKLLGGLSGARLPATSSGARPLADILANGVRLDPDIDALASVDGDRVQILVWNYHDDLVDAGAASVTLKVSLPPAFGAHATLTHARVDETHGDAYSVWVGQGSPAAPSASELAALEQAMAPALLEQGHVVDVADGGLTLSFELPRFGISLLTLVPAQASPKEQPPAGAGCSCRVRPRSSTASFSSVALLLAVALLRRARNRAAQRSPPRCLLFDRVVLRRELRPSAVRRPRSNADCTPGRP
jgi:xylan 1,4-beta-xylosidase